MSRLLALSLALAVALAVCAQAQAKVSPEQQTAALIVSKVVRAAPSAHARKYSFVTNTRPLTREQTVLPVIGHAMTGGQEWLRVRLPQRPDGATGWINANGVLLSEDPWHIVVSRAAREATIYFKGQVKRRWPVVVGKPSTPTPGGQFFVAEIVYEGYGITTGPYALATSAYSNVYQEFDGGPGQVALHGLVGLTGVPGQAASHGCMRFYDQDITWLADHVPAGTPVTIR